MTSTESPLIRLMRHHPPMEHLATKLFHEDVLNLMLLSREAYALLSPELLKHTLRCNGSSGDQWKEDWVTDMIARRDKGKLPWRLLDDQIKDALSTAPACQTQTIGAKASKPCLDCGEPLCDTCRVRTDYRSIFKPEINNVDELSRPDGDLPTRMYRSMYDEVYRKMDSSAMVERFCDFCEPPVLANMPRTPGGELQLCVCRYYSRQDDLQQLCVSCFKQRLQRFKYRVTYGWHCANRDVVPRPNGCQLLSEGRVGKCGWCSKARLHDKRRPPGWGN
jgi:hypothetical protein